MNRPSSDNYDEAIALLLSHSVVGFVAEQRPWAKYLLAQLAEHSLWNAEHSVRTAALMLELCQQFHLPEDDTNVLVAATLLHDIGKISVPEDVLDTDRPLTQKQIKDLQRHPYFGAELVKDFDAEVAALIKGHHDTADDLAYVPMDHEHDENTISPFQLIGLVDKVDALCSPRPYKSSWKPERIEQLLRRHYDGIIVETALKTWERLYQ